MSNTISIDSNIFPEFDTSIKTEWAPVFFTPIVGSYERFVIGVAAATPTAYHLEIANNLDRLNCFYGKDAEGAITAITVAAKYLEEDLARRSLGALQRPNPAVSGVSVGEIRMAEGSSLQEICAAWLGSLSSLHDNQISSTSIEKTKSTATGGDRLPFLICDYVKGKRNGYSKYFSEDLREGRSRRSKGSSHRIVIDFSGSKLVANFGTLRAGALSNSVKSIKQRLWDLKVDRDKETNTNFTRNHEMILQKPAEDDPQVSETQQANLNEATEALVEQADQEELRLRTMNTVAQIGQHILTVEAA